MPETVWLQEDDGVKEMHSRKRGSQRRIILLEARAREFKGVAMRKQSESKTHAATQVARWEVLTSHKSLF